MTRFKALNLLLFPDEDTMEIQSLQTSALRLAQTLEVDLHVLQGTETQMQEAAPGLRHLLKKEINFFEQAEELLKERIHDLFIMGYSLGTLLDPEKLSLLERVAAPVLLIPVDREMGIPPFHSLLIPVSGETRGNEAIAVGIELAEAWDSSIDIIHVSPPVETVTESIYLEEFSDEFHHEYYQMINEVIVQAAPFSTARQRTCIRDFSWYGGSVSEQITKKMTTESYDLLIVEWKGDFSGRRAHILKEVLREGKYPILLVKEPAPPLVSPIRFRLNAGKHFHRTPHPR